MLTLLSTVSTSGMFSVLMFNAEKILSLFCSSGTESEIVPRSSVASIPVPMFSLMLVSSCAASLLIELQTFSCMPSTASRIVSASFRLSILLLILLFELSPAFAISVSMHLLELAGSGICLVDQKTINQNGCLFEFKVRIHN